MKYFLLAGFILQGFSCIAQNIGIGTNDPKARLHVADSSVLFTGGTINSNAAPPVSGPGNRLMWVAPKAAFRAGRVSGGEWDTHNIGNYSFAAGFDVKATGNYSFAGGNRARAVGGSSIALGFVAAAHGTSAVALGDVASAYGESSVSIGPGTYATGYRETVLGSYNIRTNGSVDVWRATDPLLVIGNGEQHSLQSTAVTILKNGNFGIGSTLPKAKLQIDGDQLVKRNSSVGNAHLTLEETQSGDGARIQFRNSTTLNRSWELYGKPHLTNNNDALFNIYYSEIGDAMVLRGNGNVWFRGTVTQNSDARLKKNIIPLSNSLDKIGKLNGYNYHWKDSTRDQQLQTGLLAQEMEILMPELVNADSAGIKSVNYTGLIPYLIEAIKAQQQQIEVLKNEVTELKNRK